VYFDGVICCAKIPNGFYITLGRAENGIRQLFSSDITLYRIRLCSDSPVCVRSRVNTRSIHRSFRSGLKTLFKLSGKVFVGIFRDREPTPSPLSDQIEAIRKRAIRIIYPCAHDMSYTSAIFLADLPTMSDRRDQLAIKLFKSTIQPTSSLHNLPLLGNIRVYPQNFLASPPEPKKYQSFFSHALSGFIIVFFPLYLLFFCVFVFVFAFYYYCSASGYYFQ